MRGGGRVVGLIIIAIAALLFLGWSATVVASGASAGGMVLGIFVALLVCAPLAGVGLYLQRQGSQEDSQFAQVEKEKKLLNMVLTQGQVSISEIVVALQQPTDEVEEMIRNLVGKQLFSGAINWDKGLLYSVESQKLTDGKKCPNCGGELAFAGKGLIECPWCGSEVFLTKRAAASTG
jgi:ribosomal protein S27AE